MADRALRNTVAEEVIHSIVDDLGDALFSASLSDVLKTVESCRDELSEWLQQFGRD